MVANKVNTIMPPKGRHAKHTIVTDHVKTKNYVPEKNNI